MRYLYCQHQSLIKIVGTCCEIILNEILLNDVDLMFKKVLKFIGISINVIGSCSKLKKKIKITYTWKQATLERFDRIKANSVKDVILRNWVKK